MRSLLTTVVCTALCICVAATLPATAGVVIRVPQDQTTIGEALMVASWSDTVLVSCDTYNESLLTLPDGVTLKSAAAGSVCVIIDGGSTRGTILMCLSNSSGRVENITFQNGSGTQGGAVYCDNANVTFDHCFFKTNDATTGGAVYWTGGNPDIVGCTFSNNQATDSGGGIALFTTGGTIVGCMFEYNNALIGAGAFANLLDTTTAFTECQFEWNEASAPTLGGGGVYNGEQVGTSFLHCRFDNNDAARGAGAYNGTKAISSFTGCGFDSNIAGWYGGAVYGYDDNTTYYECEFTYNECVYGSGGGLYFDKSDIEMDFCTIYENSAVAGGGIMGMDGATTLDIESCTIVENTVSSRAVGGAGVFMGDNAVALIDQTIIAFNRGGEGLKCDSGGTATLTCSDVSDNSGGDWVGYIAGQELLNANIEADPYFCSVPGYWLDLCADSPCLDANNDCGLTMGAWPYTCAPCGSPVETSSWGSIKAKYR